jgi:DNA processing protein
METNIDKKIDIPMDIRKIFRDQYPFLLQQLEKLPDSMDIIGIMPPETHKFLCVVGSRSHSSYGEEVCKKLIAGLAGYPVVIVSGLAIGIDSIAHEAALEAGLKTVAFPGSGLAPNVLYPPSKRPLARRIVEAGGAIISPFKADQGADDWTFPNRNILMAGISKATLVIEAREESGTWSTIEAALKHSRDLLIVPGSIFSELSVKPLKLMREGARPVTSSDDILEELGLIPPCDENGNRDRTKMPDAPELFSPMLSVEEKKILDYLATPTSRDDLIRELALPAGYINSILVELEMKGMITERQGILMVN